MSGPKTSEYTLTPQQWANLLAQNRCDSSIIACVNQVDNLFLQINAGLGEIEIFENIGGDDSIAKTSELKRCIANIAAKQKKLKENFSVLSSYQPSSLITLTDAELTRKKAILENIRKIKTESTEIIKEISDIKKSADQIHKNISLELEENLHDAFDLSWDFDDTTTNDTSYKEALISSLLHLQSMDLSVPLKERLVNAIEKINQIENDDFLQNFRAVTLKPLADECKRYVELKTKFGDDFEELNNKYISLCKLLHMHYKEFTLSEESCDELEKEIASLEDELCKAQEQEYIADTVDAVMEEMGYNLIGNRSVTKKSGKRFRDELYTFSEGTAVNIRYDDQGKISMELGGIDTTDRIPTDSEMEKLCDDMNNFCDKFTELEKRLAEKGIVCKNRISHLPPTAEYAQIINASDYELKRNVEKIQTEYRRSRNEVKTQYRNE